MDIYDLIRNLLVYIIYPVVIVYIGLELHHYIFCHFVYREEEDDDDDREFHESSPEMCSRCRNPNCDHRLADYTED